MIVLGNGDKLQGDASVASKVDYTIHGVSGATYTLFANGQLSDSAASDLYTASAAIAITSIICVNTNTSAVTVNLFLLKSGGTARRILSKTLSIPAGDTLIFDGQKAQIGVTGGISDITAFLDDTAVGTDAIVTKAPTSNAFFDHNAAVLSSTVHPNLNYFNGYYSATVVDIPTNTYVISAGLTAFSGGDPSSKIDNLNWKGASGAYLQAEAANCTSANIRDTGEFVASMKNSYIRWAETANGLTNPGTGYISDVPDSNNLTIVRFTGADFANGYHYWIRHSSWTVPVTGIYLINAAVYYYPGEADKNFECNLGVIASEASAPTWPVVSRTMPGGYTGAGCFAYLNCIYKATKDYKLTLVAKHDGTTGTPDLYNGVYTELHIFLLQQTA